ncbi:MAG: metal-dependent transcriptional regulator [Candidatus Heimdallarchaeota archaeon]|nr:metal-dependent transcriptional regulator [Candidatus Heimdallarchaeota archaeon]MCK4253214.1 metal-dependent transcriptional regulator [Candidatus Heimdallarchaeota archaeon]
MTTVRVEEYIETIYIICLEKKIAKVSDIKNELGLNSLATVTEMVQKLDDEKLVKYEKYKGVTLTKKGFKLGKQLIETHKDIEDFFNIINITSSIASSDACLVEHIISRETAQAIKKFVEFANKEENKDIIERLETYYSKSRKNKKEKK